MRHYFHQSIFAKCEIVDWDESTWGYGGVTTPPPTDERAQFADKLNFFAGQQ